VVRGLLLRAIGNNDWEDRTLKTMNARFFFPLFGALIFAVSLVGAGCTPEETTATISQTTSTAAITSAPVNLAPQSTAIRQTTTTYSPSVVVASPTMTVAPATSVTRQTTTTYPSPAIVASPAVNMPPPATVTRQTTTTYDTSSSPQVVTTETVRNAPTVTTTYEQKAYTEDDDY
jgi:hypothetical protein